MSIRWSGALPCFVRIWRATPCGGIRKRDYPATLFYQQPWWGDYHRFVDAMSRIGMLLSEGEVAFETLMLHPQSSAWICYNNTDNTDLQKYDDGFRDL